jgi:hypothetical protein
VRVGVALGVAVGAGGAVAVGSGAAVGAAACCGWPAQAARNISATVAIARRRMDTIVFRCAVFVVAPFALR